MRTLLLLFLTLFAARGDTIFTGMQAGQGANASLGNVSITQGGVTNTSGNYFQTNKGNGSWVLLGTNAHFYFVDQLGTVFKYYTNGLLSIVQTNGSSFIVSNGSLTISGDLRAASFSGGGSQNVSNGITVTNVTMDLRGSQYTRMLGPNGGDGYIWQWFSDRLELSNHVSLSWVRFNDGIQLGSGGGAGTTAINLNRNTGDISATTFTGSGASLTAINGTQITSGTVPVARLYTTFGGYGISDTSANLAAALTDESGSGSAVFSVSPTFTGTVSISGVASNSIRFVPTNTTLAGVIYNPTNDATSMSGSLTVSGAGTTKGVHSFGSSAQTTISAIGTLASSSFVNVSQYFYPADSTTGYQNSSGTGIAFPSQGSAILHNNNGTLSTGTLTLGSLVGSGSITATNGFVTYLNNTAAPTSITVGASVFNYTNTTAHDIYVSLDANGGTTAVAYNGTTIYTSLVGGDHDIWMPPQSRIAVTYSVATPVMYSRP